MPDIDSAAAEHPPASDYKIKIDREHFSWEKPTVTGQQLRALPTPPIGPDRDVFEEVPGGEDRLIDLNTLVTLKEHGETLFFTAPHHVTPGA